ncbi:unnamed protein product [Fraxinus pennsylvanica]|uniref:Uncharacterized protein n=1 Tax=Fraxinus pennsylvanica TaxID=56036 RepID=A0AAD2AFY6_9LAMI|nr:unnamed protein product [Fraxinus pennsylvanica]
MRECPVSFQQGSTSQGISLQSGVGISRQYQNRETLAGRPKAQGRAIDVTQHDADESPNVVMGMLFIFGRNARSLIDSGATHSFISHALANHADRMFEPLDSELVIATPVGDSLLASRVYKDCGIRVNNHVLKAGLIPLNIHDFDIILGIDFL